MCNCLNKNGNLQQANDVTMSDREKDLTTPRTILTPKFMLVQNTETWEYNQFFNKDEKQIQTSVKIHAFLLSIYLSYNYM